MPPSNPRRNTANLPPLVALTPAQEQAEALRRAEDLFRDVQNHLYYEQELRDIAETARRRRRS